MRSPGESSSAPSRSVAFICKAANRPAPDCAGCRAARGPARGTGAAPPAIDKQFARPRGSRRPPLKSNDQWPGPAPRRPALGLSCSCSCTVVWAGGSPWSASDYMNCFARVDLPYSPALFQGRLRHGCSAAWLMSGPSRRSRASRWWPWAVHAQGNSENLMGCAPATGKLPNL